MGKGLLAAGGLLAALGASTCCVLPISLTALGLSDAWLSTLDAVAKCEVGFRIAAILFLAAGFWFVYVPPNTASQAPVCPTSPSNQVTKIALWGGAAVMVVVFAMRLWMPMLPMA
jgi:mercuric ion transport protein